MADTVHKSGLTNANYLKLRNYVLQREGGGSYIPIDPQSNTPGLNRLGYAGGFQMGTMALKGSGYINSTASNSNDELRNPANWRDANGKPLRGNIGSLDDFLNSPAAQNDAHLTYTNQNVRAMINIGRLQPNAPQDEIAGWAAASQFGSGNMQKYGLDFVDGNGTVARSYYVGAKNAVNNTADSAVITNNITPGSNATASGAPSGASSTTSSNSARNSSTTKSSPGTLYVPMTKLGETGLGNQITLGATAPISNVGPATTGPIPNVLHSFVSFNPLFTFSSLNKDQINNSSFTTGDIGEVIFSSGGRTPNNRASTANTSSSNSEGKFDFFIDNVEMETLVAPQLRTKGTSVIALNFDLYEPYSMGTFLQSCQIAAFSNGHINYAESPFLMTLKFLGYGEDDRVMTVPGSTRYFPVRIFDVGMEVTGKGCKYTVKCIAWGETALSDNFNLLKQNVSISGKDVREMLQSGINSLQYVINSRLQEISKAAKDAYLPDEVLIEFPKTGAVSQTSPTANKGATSSSGESPSSQLVISKSSTTYMFEQSPESVNSIGTASLEFDLTRGGLYPKISEDRVHSKGIYKRNLISAEVKGDQRQFVFQQGTSIINAITEVVLMSEYCTSIAKNVPDKDGMLDWFRIDTQVYLKEGKPGNAGNGSAPKLLVYKVIPYKIHSSMIQSPTQKPVGYDELKKNAPKVYDYLYTGKNLDVLDFKINFKTGLFTKTYADNGKYNEYALNTNDMSQGGNDIAPKTIDNSGNMPNGDVGIGVKSIGKLPDAWRNSGGSASDTYKTLVAKQFHYQLLSSNMADMVTGDLTILGDPYFISDSGVGNFSNTGQGARRTISPTGAMDYQSSEVDIVVNFRTPIDIGTDGIMEFAKSNLEVPFSGLYKVINVKSTFNKGQFTQTLALLRRINQNPFSNETAADRDDAAMGAAMTALEANAGPAGIPGKYAPIVTDDIRDPNFNTYNDVYGSSNTTA
jgi:hypothetical protein